MERFGLTRHDLMVMSWSQVVMLFDSTYVDDEDDADAPSTREATPEEYSAWV